ncbi:hypothetical protein SAMN06297387_103259 [Streptomyces zhaozhouensis]|uniref:Uncharacterized protein n=1 Tax=Streptomyces zhaozhouensis TaxID=1300267 RepID=A0A286DSF3_9ACTN|nr:hypothetical protein [Streptomyces zhaozhouensis]SOD61607.1 hypothetical protein SAMN06297387_103259 [Streptomyces zhaozhouensis]
MSDLGYNVVLLVLALRVLGPDALRLLRRLLGAGVRIGAAALAEHRTGQPANALPVGGEEA